MIREVSLESTLERQAKHSLEMSGLMHTNAMVNATQVMAVTTAKIVQLITDCDNAEEFAKLVLTLKDISETH